MATKTKTIGKKSAWPKVAILLLAAVVISAGSILIDRAAQPSPKSLPTVSTKPASAPLIPNFNHIIVIMEENEGNGDLVDNPHISYINRLIKNYAYADNYSAIGHPSVPNYLWLTSGTDAGLNTDCVPNTSDDSCIAKVKNIADTIEASGRTWKAYMEDMPTACSTDVALSWPTNLYDIEHNPFVYYSDIVNNKSRCDKHDVPFSQFAHDLASADTLPDFSFISPNLCNDMHNYKTCPMSIGDAWLAQVTTQIMDSPAYTDSNSLIAITWDEGSTQDGTKSLDNKVPLLLIGSQVKQRFVSTRAYTHLSLLHTIEKAWGLTPLTPSDAQAPTLEDFFNE